MKNKSAVAQIKAITIRTGMKISRPRNTEKNLKRVLTEKIHAMLSKRQLPETDNLAL